MLKVWTLAFARVTDAGIVQIIPQLCLNISKFKKSNALGYPFATALDFARTLVRLRGKGEMGAEVK